MIKRVLKSFSQRLNNNTKNIHLSLEYHDGIIHFLDLSVELQNHEFITKTFFKPVDRNSYIPTDSCHHDPWLINIPKGQLIRLRGNCTNEYDFNDQARFIGKSFIQRGYDGDFINRKIEEVTRMERTSLIQDHPKNDRTIYDLPIILNFHIQHQQVEKLFRKH